MYNSKIIKKMKCNHCNSDVADGTKFCPECGNRIEQPQLLKCPQCSTVVGEGVKFCPECGCPIAEPKPTICSKCGTEIEEGEKFCSNCGTPVTGQKTIAHISSSESQNHNNGHLVTFKWSGGGGFSLGSNTIKLVVDGKQYGEFKHKDPFEISVPISSSKMKVQIKYLYIITEFVLDLAPNQNYECVLQFSGGWFGSGVIAYELTDQKNNFVVADGNVSIGAQILFLVIPIIGYIYFFMKKETEPICAKVGLVWGIANTLWCVLFYVFN